MSKDKIIMIIAGLAIVLAGTALVVSLLKTSPAQNVGIGGLEIENYLPIIKHNEGYYSRYGITTTGNISGAAITGTGALTVTGTTATSTFFTGGLIVATNKFIIEQSSGKLGIGTSTPANFISGHLSNTASLDFGVIAANSCSDLTIGVIGAADGNTVYLGVPNALAVASSTFIITGWVSAADTVKVHLCQTAALASSDPAAATIRADVWKH